MSTITTLYKRNAKGNIIRWQIHQLKDGTIGITHGIFGAKPITELITPTLVKANEVQSRIKAKRKEGYKSLEDIWDNAPKDEHSFGSDFDLDKVNLYKYLDTYLPKYNTTDEGFVLPMLAKTLEDNKPFEKFGTMLGQWKINGLRCLIGAKKNEGDIFNPIVLTYTSREGTSWNLHWMDEIILSKLSTDLVSMMVEEDVYLDGELYIPNCTVNEINSYVKNNKLPQHRLLQYWCYDIACENTTAEARNEFRLSNIDAYSHAFANKTEHYNNKEPLVLLPTCQIQDVGHATLTRNDFILTGFEGLILRNPHAEYAFGKRNSSMFKYKKKEDGLFEIVDIKEDKRGLPIYTLRNDINDELFECTINLSQNAQRTQLAMKDMLIGKKGLVEYRERSGKKQVPFHAKLITVYV